MYMYVHMYLCMLCVMLVFKGVMTTCVCVGTLVFISTPTGDILL